MNPEVKGQRYLQAAKVLEEKGAIVEEFDLGLVEYAIPGLLYVIASAEASSNLARFDGVKYGLSDRRVRMAFTTCIRKSRTEGFGPEVKTTNHAWLFRAQFRIL